MLCKKRIIIRNIEYERIYSEFYKVLYEMTISTCIRFCLSYNHFKLNFRLIRRNGRNIVIDLTVMLLYIAQSFSFSGIWPELPKASPFIWYFVGILP